MLNLAERRQFFKGVVNKSINYFVDYTKDQDYRSVESEIDNLIAAIDMASHMKMNKELIEGVNAFYHFWHVPGKYVLARTYLKLAEKAGRELNDDIGLTTTLLHLGNVEEKF